MKAEQQISTKLLSLAPSQMRGQETKAAVLDHYECSLDVIPAAQCELAGKATTPCSQAQISRLNVALQAATEIRPRKADTDKEDTL